MKYAFVHCNLVDGTEDMQVLDDRTVLIEDGIITQILDGSAAADVASSPAVSDGYRIIDLSGRFLLPGLINLHAHMFGSGKPSKVLGGGGAQKLVLKFAQTSAGMRYLDKTVAANAATALNAGTTTLRCVGDFRYSDVHTRDRIRAGQLLGSRMIVSGPALTVRNGHGDGTFGEAVETPEDCRRLVQERVDAGVDFIKICVTGGVMDSQVPGEAGLLRMNLEQAKAICDEARRLGKTVASHTEGPEGLEVDLDAGVHTIEHGCAIDDEAAEKFKATGAVDVATISVAVPVAFLDPEVTMLSPASKVNGRLVFDRIIAGAKTALEHGIPVGLGTDAACPFITHYDMWREPCYYVKYVGVSNSFALHTVTALNARILGIDDITGTIEVGKCADLIVVKDNPLEDLTTLRDVQMVMAQGTLIEHPSIKRIPAIDGVLDKLM